MILVVGGNGFLGRPYCEKLYEKGAEFISVGRSPSKIKKYPYITCDITDKTKLDSIISTYRVRVVVNFAAKLLTDSAKDPVNSFMVNVFGPFNLLDICVKRGVQRFIYASSYSAVGDLKQHMGAVKEDTPCRPVDFYGSTKLFVEHMGAAFANRFGLEFVAARIAMIVGPGKPSRTSAWRAEMFNKLSSGGNLNFEYRPEEILPLSYSEDVVDALQAITFKKQLNHQLYHLKYETWQVSELALLLRELQPNLNITYGERRTNVLPPKVDTSLVLEEFGLKQISLRERLSQHISAC